MADKELKVRLKPCAHTSTEWAGTYKDKVLLNGEIGYEKNTGRYKIGDGTNKWADLPWAKATPYGDFIPLNTSGGIGSISGGGEYGYCLIATIKISNKHINRPITFEISGRGFLTSIVQVMFQNIDHTDPKLSSFTTNGYNKFYIVKSDTSTWKIYGMYTEVWGSLVLHRITGSGSNIGVTVNLENVDALPAGTTQASYYGNVSYATNAGSATQANKLTVNAGSSTNPVYFSGGVPTACSGRTVPGIKSASEVTTLGWGTNNNYVADISLLSYWNGAYSGTSSNLAYCKQGAFGTIVTKAAGDYLAVGGTAVAAKKLVSAVTLSSYAFTPSTYIADGGVVGLWNNNQSIDSNGYPEGNTSGGILFGRTNAAVVMAARAGQTVPTIYVKQYYQSWGDWALLLHSSNYTSYTVKKDGTGASGTWGINISGNAATATKATQDGSGKTITSTYLKLTGGTLTISSYYGLKIKRSDANGSAISYLNSNGAIGGAGFLSDGNFQISSGENTNGNIFKASTTAATFPGTVTATKFIGNLTGNADTAGKWSTARKITLTGSVTGSVSIDGSGDVSLATTTNHTHGLLHSSFAKQIANTTTDSGWSMINSAYKGYILMSLRTQADAPAWIQNNYAAGIAFGGADTKGVLSMAYGSPKITFAGGNGTKPVWYFTLTGTSATTYNLDTFAKKDGSNASGTWGINISGNAATATNATNAVSATTASILGRNTSYNYSIAGVTWFDIDGKAGAAVQANDTPTTAWWHILRFNHSNPNEYYTDLAVPFNNNSLYYKQIKAGALQNGGWVKVLDSLNYNEYAPKKDGTGASGTWGISITGNAATANQWATARTLTIGDTGKSVNGSGNVSWTSSEVGYRHEWSCIVTCSTWSRLCYVTSDNPTIGASFLLNIGATRGSVVYNDTFIIKTHHHTSGKIIKISGHNYSLGYQVRLLVDTYGHCYVELYDNINGATSSTAQTVYCRLIPIYCDTITKYTSFTSGTSLPSGFSVTQTMTLDNNDIQANVAGNLYGNATTATTATKANTVLGNYTGNGGQQNPNYFGTNKVGFLMMNTIVNGNSQYKDWMIMDCYNASDVGGGVAFGVNRQSLGAYIMRSDAARTSWAQSAELLGTHNYSSYALPLTGGTLTGNLTVKADAATSRKVIVNNTNRSIALEVHSNGEAGLYDHTHSQWLIWGDKDGTGVLIPNKQLIVDGDISSIGGLLKSDANDCDLVMGAQNGSYCHMYADLPFYFNQSITSVGHIRTTYTSGTSSIGSNFSSGKSFYLYGDTSNASRGLYDDNAGFVIGVSNSGATFYGNLSGNASSAGYVTSDNSMRLYAQYNNEINFGGTNAASNIYFGYRAVDSKPIPTNFYFGGSDGTANIIAKRIYSRSLFSSTAYGATMDLGPQNGSYCHMYSSLPFYFNQDILINGWSLSSHTHNYLPLAGGTMNSSAVIAFSGAAGSVSASTPMSITYPRIACYGTLYINADTDNSGSEHILLTAGKGVSGTLNDGLAIGQSTLTWQGSTVVTGQNCADYTSSSRTIDLTSLNQNTWYPVYTSIPYNGLRRTRVAVQLNSGSKPSWSTHDGGFTMNLDVLVKACGWGTTDGLTLFLENEARWCDTSKGVPAYFQQLTNGSKAVFYLRGGGKYTIHSDWNAEWTIATSSTTISSQTIAPTTSAPSNNGYFILNEGNYSSRIRTLSSAVIFSSNATVNGTLTAATLNVSGHITGGNNIYASKSGGEAQNGVKYNGGGLYFWGNNSGGSRGIYDTKWGYVVRWVGSGAMPMFNGGLIVDPTFNNSAYAVNANNYQTFRVYDSYNISGTPTTYGNVLEINGRDNHWKPQIWCSAGATSTSSKGALYYRNRDYNATSMGSWIKIITQGNFSLSGTTLTITI